MASLLRRPGNLAKYSRSAADRICRTGPAYTLLPRSRLRSFDTAQRIRTFATQGPKPPKDENGRKPQPRRNGGDPEPAQKSEGRETQKPQSEQPKPEEKSKPEESQSEQPKPEESKPEESQHEEPKPEESQPQSKLTEEEEKHLQVFLDMIKESLGGSQMEHLEVVRKVCRRDGLTPEIQAFIQKHVVEMRKPTLIDNMKMVNHLTNISAKETVFNNSGGQKHEQKQNGGQKQGQGQQGPSGKIQLDPASFIISSVLSYYLYRSMFPGESRKDITWQEFRNNFFDKGLVESLTVFGQSRVRVELNREATASAYPDSPASSPQFHYYFTIGSVESFERRLDQAQDELEIPSQERIPVTYSGDDSVPWVGMLVSFGPTLLFFGGLYYMTRRAGGGGANSGGGLFGVGKSKAKRFNQETDVKVKFNDVAGMDEAKVEIMEFVSFLKNPEKFQKLGAKIPRGAILQGPPGTGKTMLAKATAGESGVPFFSVSGSEFVEMFVGVGPSRVRDLFATARKSSPCIIFIDEIDAIGKARSKRANGGGNDERESTLNQILTEMDGFNTSEKVVVLAGTNRVDMLDQALTRPGRFDRHINVDLPTMDGRKQIFRVYLKEVVTSENLEHVTGKLAALTPGFAGADIANCVNEAALVAAREGADRVTLNHFERAIERVIGGLEKKSLVLVPDEKRVVAYHEAGHAICGWYLRWADPLLKVSIIPRGSSALGYAQYLPGDNFLLTTRQLKDRMAMTLGGRVSEELHFEDVTSGASDDFKRVTQMATHMVTKLGMSEKLKYIHYDQDSQNQFSKPFSEETARAIDVEVRNIVEEAHNHCHAVLTSRKKEIGLVAEELLSKEVLGREDMIRLLGPREWPDKPEFAKYFGQNGQKQNGKEILPPESPTDQAPTPPS